MVDGASIEFRQPGHVEGRESAPSVDVRVTAGPAGATGPDGPAGDPADLGVIIPLTPAGTVWTVTYDLPIRPSVTVTDSAGNVVYCDVQHLSATQINISTDASFSGEASLT